MINEKSNMRTKALYNDDKTHRYILKKSWDNSKPSVSIIMVTPSNKAGEVCIDMTSMYVINNCFKQGFGCVEISNLYSKLNENSLETDQDNDKWILKSCQKSDKVILAWGKRHSEKFFNIRVQEVIKLLEPCKDKLFEISDELGNNGLHPLARTVRLNWYLTEYKEKKE